MSPLSSVTSMQPSTPNSDGAGQAQEQNQDPGQARFADILRQRQGASPAPGKPARETAPADTPTEAGDAAGIDAQVADNGRTALPSLDVAAPGTAPDPAQLPLVWTPPVAMPPRAVAEKITAAIAGRANQADAIANRPAGRLSDQMAAITENGAGNDPGRAVAAQPGIGRSVRSDNNGPRPFALQPEDAGDQPTVGKLPVASTAGAERPRDSGSDTIFARTEPLAWSALPVQPEINAARNPGAAPHTLSIEARVGTARFADETAQQVTWLAKNGIEHAEIRVKPADLGPISVRIEMQNNEAVISFAVTQPETRVAVEDALHRLQEMLAESGISMGETSVGGHSFGQQLHDQRETSRQRYTFAARGELHAGVINGIGARAQTAARGLVDTFA